MSSRGQVRRIEAFIVSGFLFVCGRPELAQAAVPDTKPPVSTASASSDTNEPPAAGWIGLPAVSYAPETSLALGAYLLHHFPLDAESYASSVSLLAMGTLKRQAIVELKPEFYWSENQNRLEFYLEGQRFPDKFYGVGNSVQEQEKENYDRRFLRSRVTLRRHLLGDIYVGLSSDQLWMEISDVEPDGLLATGGYLGSDGGFSSGLGVNALWDTRDSRTYPTSGQMLDLQLVPYWGALGSDFEFTRLKSELRSFWSLWRRQVLAVRYSFELTTGDAPFYLLPYLGGPNLLRGYFLGKYRDQSAQVFEAEYRLHVAWRLGAVAFAGAGQVGPKPGEMFAAALRPSVGGGLRFDFSKGENMNLRVDAGGWPGTFGLYVSMLEVF